MLATLLSRNAVPLLPYGYFREDVQYDIGYDMRSSGYNTLFGVAWPFRDKYVVGDREARNRLETSLKAASICSGRCVNKHAQQQSAGAREGEGATVPVRARFCSSSAQSIAPHSLGTCHPSSHFLVRTYVRRAHTANLRCLTFATK